MFGSFAVTELGGVPCFVTRTGYTGEDGFEISVPNERAVELTEKIMAAGCTHLAGALPVRSRTLCSIARALTLRRTPRQAWARATACAWRRGCACTATT